MNPIITVIVWSVVAAAAHISLEAYARRRRWSANAELAAGGALWLLMGTGMFLVWGGR